MSNPELMRELAELLGEKAKRVSRNKLATYYPDDGPLRRELYPKHLDFFKAGAFFRERCVLAGNRVGKCLTSNTILQTPAGDFAVGDLYAAGEGFPVWAWDGSGVVQARASAPFKKPGLHQCFRVTMSDGSWFEAADDHRLLCADGSWRFLRDVFPRIFCGPPEGRPAFVPGSLGTTPGIGPSNFPGDGPRSCETPQGCQGRCSVGCRPCGAQPRLGPGTDPATPPPQGDAPQQPPASLRTGDQGDICTSTRKSSVGPRANSHSPRLCGVREAAGDSSGCPTPSLCAAMYCGLHPESRPPDGKTALAPQLTASVPPCPQTLSFVSPFELSSGDTISVECTGWQEVYDFEVEYYHNYVSSGAVHHNSEGIGGYETAVHLTGLYPDWWAGHRFTSPIRAWCCGDTGKTCRDINQLKLLGPVGAFGTGLIPAHTITNTTAKPGVPDAVESVRVKHVSGGESSIIFKSYDQGRIAYQGTEQHLIWLDEEPPFDIYVECVMRTTSTPWFPGGLIMCTFTPLSGISDVVLTYLPGGKILEGE